MKKIFNISYWLGLLSGIIFTFVGLYLAFWIDSRSTEIVDVNEVEGVDTICIDDPYMGMTKEKFCKEMQKGCYGDLTQKQIDSLQFDLALFNHGVPDSVIKIWDRLTDKQRVEAILGVPNEYIRLWNKSNKKQKYGK
jgi:hypothetical protein